MKEYKSPSVREQLPKIVKNMNLTWILTLYVIFIERTLFYFYKHVVLHSEIFVIIIFDYNATLSVIYGCSFVFEYGYVIEWQFQTPLLVHSSISYTREANQRLIL